MSVVTQRSATMARVRAWVGRACSVIAALSALSPLSHAQTDPRLAASVRLAQEGQSDSARAEIQRLLAATPPRDTLYPQILYSAAMIAPTTREMQRYLQRVVVEHPSSEWVDESRVRLAQIDYGNGDLAGAARALERIRVDYPSSPLFPIAAQWAARAYFGLDNRQAACGWVSEGLARAGDNVEQRNQLAFYARRCEDVAAGPAAATDSSGSGVSADSNLSGVAAPAADSTAIGGRDARPTQTRGDASSPIYRVQVAAVASQATADKTLASVKRLGLPTRIVRENGLFKVRAGEYATRADALAAAATLKAKLGGAPFIVVDR